MSSVKEAEEIIKENIIGFFNWKKNRENIPLITRIQDKGDLIKKLEIKLAKKRLENGISIEEVLDGLAKGITNKFLHNAYKTLNSNTSEEQEITEMWIKKIYGIDSNNE
jgi:glutamyl-tRNA reductase